MYKFFSFISIGSEALTAAANARTVCGAFTKCDNNRSRFALSVCYAFSQQRNYTTALTRHEFGMLRKAATGGRGRRGTKVRKKNVTVSDMYNVQKKFKWPGLNAPLSSTKVGMVAATKQLPELYSSEEESNVISSSSSQAGTAPQRKGRKYTKGLSRGWTGNSWGGCGLGPPQTADGSVLDAFDSTCIELRRVVNQTTGGKRPRMRALVVVGNRNGAVGYAFGKGQDGRTAFRKAKNKAVNYLYYVDRCEGQTIYHDAKTKFKKTYVKLEKRHKGAGLRCHRAITAVCELAGISDLRAKVIGSTNPGNIIHATFKALQNQETFEQLAERTKLNVVQFCKENGFRPVLLASPKDNIAQTVDKHQISAPHNVQIEID